MFEPKRESEEIKPILVKGNNLDIERIMNIAYDQARRVFKTNNKLKIIDIKRWEPYGWVCLVVKPSAVAANASGRIEAEKKPK